MTWRNWYVIIFTDFTVIINGKVASTLLNMPPISFPIKLWNMLNSRQQDTLRWSGDGSEVLVNEERFDELVEQHPSFLRQRTLSGLQRLFAVYEFHRDDQEDSGGWIRYSHPCFVRGQPDLLEIFVLEHQTRRYIQVRWALLKPGNIKVGRLHKAQFM